MVLKHRTFSKMGWTVVSVGAGWVLRCLRRGFGEGGGGSYVVFGAVVGVCWLRRQNAYAVGTSARILTHERRRNLHLPVTRCLNKTRNALIAFRSLFCTVRFRSWSETRFPFGPAWKRSDTCGESLGSPGPCEYDGTQTRNTSIVGSSTAHHRCPIPGVLPYPALQQRSLFS